MVIETSQRCPICGQIVGKDASVCASCGYSLLKVCHGCGTPAQMQYSYCPFCGRPLVAEGVQLSYQELLAADERNRNQLMEYASDLTKLYMTQRRVEKYLPTGLLDKVLLSDSQVVGERRYLTVVFSDVVGFTDLSAKLDPEDVFLLMNNCFRLLVEQVYKFGGSVDKFIGDALMALFGAPISYGNDAERAVRAALGMQEAMAELNQQLLPKLGRPLELRIGITSGDAIAGTVGVEGQWSYTVMGNTVNLASRLQSAANPGDILVNEDVYHCTKGVFNYHILPPVSLKGISEAVPVFEVTKETSATSKAQQLPVGQLSPFIGRQKELTLFNRLTLDLEDGQGGVIFVTGEAGLGKTRLMWEWQRQIPDSVQVWSGFAQNLSQTGYEVWQQIILHGLRLGQASHQTVSGVLFDYLGDGTWLPYLEILLFGEAFQRGSLASLEPEQLKEQIFIAVTRLLSSIARRKPLIIMLDNLQWADQLSRELLQAALSLLKTQPIFFCLGSRLEAEELPAFVSFARETLEDRVFEINLDMLSEAESEAFLAQKLPLENMPQKLRQYISERAQHNPYYLEELVSFIINSGFVEKRDGHWHITNLPALNKLSLPGTLRGLVRAQLDRLPEVHQQILSYGAVIGPIFSSSLSSVVLSDVPRLNNSSEILADLVNREILAFDGANFRFVHNSVHETLYQSLLSERRAQMHQHVGEAIEARAGAAVKADVEQLAYHYAAAGNALKAIPYLIEAGEKTRQRFANNTALNYFSTALDMLIPEMENRRAEICQAMGSLYQHQGDYDNALKYYLQALDLATTPNQRTNYHRLIGRVWQWKGDIAKAQKGFEDALREISRWHNQISPSVRGRVYANMGFLCLRQGDYVHAERWSLDAVSVLEMAEEHSDLARSLNALGGAYYFQNRWAEASEQVERALKIQQKIDDRMGIARSLTNLGVLYRVNCEWDKAINAYTQAIEMSEDMGTLEAVLSNAHNNIAVVYLHQGLFQLAETHLQKSLTIKQGIGTTFEVPETLNNLGFSRLLQGDLEPAESYINRSIEICREKNEQASLCEAMRYQAELQLAQGNLDAALETCQAATVLANKSASKVDEGSALRTLARIFLQKGQLQQAKQAATTSLRLFKGINHAFEVTRTRIVLAEIALAEKDDEAFQKAVTRAQPFLEKLHAQPELDKLKNLKPQP